MKKTVLHANIADVNGDALIYSTNVQLGMFGGVGAALKEKYGFQIQMALVEAFKHTRQIQTKVGDVYRSNLDYTPWQLIFHTIATDELCNTNPATVSSILEQCLSECDRNPAISSIVCSPLGAGYGDLSPKAFCELLKAVMEPFESSSIEEFRLVCNDQKQFDELASILNNPPHHSWAHSSC